MSSISIGNTFIYSLIPFGHYIYRIMSLKGSTDHMWTFFPLFNIFPFSLIPMFMIYFDAIKKGKIENIFEVFNYAMVIPIMWRILGQVLMNNYFEPNFLGFAFLFFTTFLVIFCTNLFERYTKCKEIDSNKILLTFIDTLNLTFFMNFYSMLFIYLGTKLDDDIQALSPRNTILGGIIWMIFFIYYQSIFNMANIQDPETYCNPNITSTGNIIKYSLWCVYAFFIIFLELYGG